MGKVLTIEEAQMIYTTGSTVRGMGNQHMAYALEKNLESIRKGIERSRKGSGIDQSEEMQKLRAAENSLIKKHRELPAEMTDDEKDAWFEAERKKLTPFQEGVNELTEKWRQGTIEATTYTITSDRLRALTLDEIQGAPRDPKHSDAQFLNQYRARYNWLMVMLDCVIEVE